MPETLIDPSFSGLGRFGFATNGGTVGLTDNQLKAMEMVHNMAMSRAELLQKFTDPRRDFEAECGYPESIEIVNAQKYQDLYDTEPMATRVVQLMPKECWQMQPSVHEDDDEDNVTEFEEAWDELGKQLRPESKYKDESGSIIWDYLYRLDMLSGIGTFGILLLGIDDGKLLEQPVDGCPPDGYPTDQTGVSQDQNGRGAAGESKDIYGGVVPNQPLGQVGTDAQYFQTQFSPFTPPKKKPGKPKLIFLKVFAETLVQVVQYEAVITNPRFGHPLMYMVTINDPRQPHTGVGLPMATVRVHWSRVIHVPSDSVESSEVFGVPRCRPVIRPILDCSKIRGAGAEGYWRACISIISLETHPQLGGDVIMNSVANRNMMENIFGGMQRYAEMSGMSMKSVAPTITDPASQIDKNIEAICIVMECPVRVFKGSERGELASSQDDSDWNGRVHGRRLLRCTPKIIVQFIDRLIMIGVLPEPEEYHIDWPDPENLGDKDKAAIGLQITQALAAYMSGNVESIFPPADYLVKVFGGLFSKEEVDEIMENAARHVEDKQGEAEDMADEHGFEPMPPPGFQKPEPEPPVVPPTPIKVKPGEKLVHPASVKAPPGANGKPVQPQPTKV